MTRHARLLAFIVLATTSTTRAADPENLGARPYVAPPRQNFDQDGPPISRSDSLLRRGDLRILDPGPDLLDGPPRSREAWQQLVERDVDRVMGRVEPQDVFDLRQMRQDRSSRLDRLEPRREFERFEEQRDRTLRLEQQARDQARSTERRRIVERESERLKAERDRFQRAMNTDTTSGAVAQDAVRLQTLTTVHEAELRGVANARAAKLAAIDADQTLTPEQRAAHRAATEQAYDRIRAERIERYEGERATLSGFPREKKGGR